MKVGYSFIEKSVTISKVWKRCSEYKLNDKK